MPFNGSGTFTRAMNWVSDATAGIKIRADRHDTEDDGFAQGLSNTICRDGQSTIAANIPFSDKRITGLANPVNPQDAMTFATFKAGLIDRFASVAADMSMLFRTSGNRLVVNDKADGAGTDIMGLIDTGAQWWTRTVTGTSGNWVIFDTQNIGRFSLYENFANDTMSIGLKDFAGTTLQTFNFSAAGITLDLGAAAGSVITSGNVCYKGFDNQNQVFPIGSVVLAREAGGAGMNTANNPITIYLTANPNFQYGTTGTFALAGTWVSRGLVIGAASLYSVLAQRVS